VPIQVRQETASDLLVRRGPRFAPILASDIEYALLSVLSRIKLISIENPRGNVLPVIDYIKCEQHPWKDVLDMAAKNARLIVVACDEDSRGLRYELGWLSQNRALEKTWFISDEEFLSTLHKFVPGFSELALSVTTFRVPLRYVKQLSLPNEVSPLLSEASRAVPANNANSDA
jgi:hypothetical protein